MPVSSKKQRGKQRKAAKNQTASAASTSATTTIPNGLELEALVTERYALLISMGDHDATTSL